MWQRTRGKLLSTRRVDKNHVQWLIEASSLASEVRPGQFVHITSSETQDPFLRRPISIFTCDKQSGTLGLLFRVIGQGTHYLASLKAGAEVDMLGPLGNGWPEAVAGRAILVAGGIGVAPMPYLARHYVECGKDVAFLLGARTEGELLAVSEIQHTGARLSITTDDGSHGHEGFVTDLLLREIRKDQEEKTVLACGPGPMLRAVQQMARDHNVQCYVSLEQRMGCAVGACLGCAVRLAPPNTGYKKVCSDGPVFDAKMVVIEDV